MQHYYQQTHEPEVELCIACRRPEIGYGDSGRLCKMCADYGHHKHIMGHHEDPPPSEMIEVKPRAR